MGISFFDDSFHLLNPGGYFVLAALAPSDSKEVTQYYYDRSWAEDPYPGYMTIERCDLRTTVDGKNRCLYKLYQVPSIPVAKDFPGKIVVSTGPEDKFPFLKSVLGVSNLLKRYGVKYNIPDISSLLKKNSTPLRIEKGKFSTVLLDLAYLEKVALKAGFNILDSRYFNISDNLFYPKEITIAQLSLHTYHSYLVVQKPVVPHGV